MNLADLDASLRRLVSNNDTSGAAHDEASSVASADGVLFQCPKCFAANGAIGTHYVLCWTPKVPPHIDPKPGRWPFTGTSLADLTLSPSVRLIGGCNAHFYVRAGKISMCD